MTSFHDPARPRLGNGLPTWIGGQVALPDLHLVPAEQAEGQDGQVEPKWLAEIILDGAWVQCLMVLGKEALWEMLSQWEQDPEMTLKVWFGRNPPQGRGQGPGAENKEESAGTLIAKVNAEDLGL